MKKLGLILSFLTLLFIISCSKKDDVVIPIQPVYNQPVEYFGTWISGDGKIILQKNLFQGYIEGGLVPIATNWEVKDNYFYEYKKDGSLYVKIKIITAPTSYGTFNIGGIVWTKE